MAGQEDTQPTEPQSLDSLAAMVMEETDTEVEDGEESTEEQEGEELVVADEDSDQESDDEAEEAESEDDSDDATFTIKHDDKEVALKKSEVLELAQKGFDYTKKTMAVAEERKAVEQAKAQYSERLSHQDKALEETIARLNTAAQFLEAELGAPPSIELAQYDAASYLAQKEAYESRVAKLRNTYGHIQHLTQEQNQLRQSQLLEQAAETEKYLVEKLPGWKDAPEKSLQELNSYIQQYGLSPETTKDAYVQAGLWEIAHKAREYDALMARKAELKPKAAAVPKKVMKPSTNPVPPNVRQQEAIKRHKSQKSLDSLSGLVDFF